jgi:hypothetical protein
MCNILKNVEKLCNEASAGEKVSSGTILATFPYLFLLNFPASKKLNVTDSMTQSLTLPNKKDPYFVRPEGSSGLINKCLSVRPLIKTQTSI